MITLNLSDDQAARVYAALMICTPSGGRTRIGNMHLDITSCIPQDVTNMAHNLYLKEYEDIVLAEYFEILGLTRTEADQRLRSKSSRS